ncbi:hypothetical protein PHYSODRAFT_491501, partial [Phytophthora sojae]
VVQWLHDNLTDGCTARAINWTAMYKLFDVVRWLRRNEYEAYPGQALYRAVGAGYFDVEFLTGLDWRDDESGCTTNAMNAAAENGYLKIVKWLHLNRAATGAMNSAAKNDHLNIVKWLHQHRTEGRTTKAMDYAALNGHLKVVQWLHSNRREGCTTRAMDFAVERGILEVVKWLHENRSEECSTNAMDCAA